MVYNIKAMKEIIKTVGVKYNLGKIEIIECDMFACEPKEKILYIAKDDEDEIEIEGNKFLEKYLDETFDLKIPYKKMYIFSVLHELGHLITFPSINEKQYWKEISEENEDFLKHRQVYGEYIADKWAIEYIKNNNII